MDTPGEDVVQRQYHDPDWKDKGVAQQPFGRLLDPNEVARCIAYCASDESGMMTGCVIDFDQSVIGAGPAYVNYGVVVRSPPVLGFTYASANKC